MADWMIISKPEQPTPERFWYIGDFENAEAAAALIAKSEDERSGLTLWKLAGHTTVDVDVTIVAD